MGCGASSLRGDDFTTINADMRSPLTRKLSSAEKAQAQSAPHYETPAEHDRDLQLLSSSQRRASRPAYVDPNDQPMPPKTTHQHYHRSMSSESGMPQARTGSLAERVKKVRNEVMTPADQRGMGRNTGLTRDEVLARQYPARGSQGSMIPGMKRASQSNNRGLIQ